MLSSVARTFGTLFIFVVALHAVPMTSSPCPLLGPDYPAPRNLSKNAIVRKANTSLSELIRRTVQTSSSSFGLVNSSSTTFSINIFSAHESKPLFEYHHTAPALTNSSSGTKSVDGDTVYRIGSITKIVTVLAFLMEAGDVYFNDPITKYIPELAAAAAASKPNKNSTSGWDYIDDVQWNDVTVGALASQMAGIGRSCMSSRP
jgi:hypothetical protein